MNDRKKMFRWVESHNSAIVIGYHNQIKQLMQNEVIWMQKKIDDPSCDPEFKIEQQLRKTLFEKDYLYRHRGSVFLMLFSHLEEFLEHYRTAFSPNITKDRRKSSIGRFAPVIKSAGVDLGTCEQWPFLANCAYLRDCALHANGRVSLSRNKPEIEKFVAGQLGAVTIEGDSIKIGGAFLDELNKAIDSLINLLLEDSGSEIKT